MMKQSTPEEFASKWKVARACARCHRLKSKCIYEDPSYESCQRCFSLGIKCSVDEDPTATRSKRRHIAKPTKSTDQILNKVDTLLSAMERELSYLDKATFDRGASSRLVEQAMRLEAMRSSVWWLQDGEANKMPLPNGGGSVSLSGSPRMPETPENLANHLIYNLKVISEEEARLRYSYFHESVVEFFPAISLPSVLRNFGEAMHRDQLFVVVCIYVTTLSNQGLSGKMENRALFDTLKSYLDMAMAKAVYINASNFSYMYVYSMLILSLWAVPPRVEGSFKSQIDIIAAYAITLCIDAGNVALSKPKAVFDDESVERNNLRCFLACYCNCSSLSFSLPRFRMASWSPRHDLAVEALTYSSANRDPCNKYDQFLCLYSKLVCIGEQVCDYFFKLGANTPLYAADDEFTGPSGLSTKSLVSQVPSSLSFEALNDDSIKFETKMRDLFLQTGYDNDPTLQAQHQDSRNRYCFLFTFYHLLIMVHDNVVSWCIHKLTSAAAAVARGEAEPQISSDVIAQHIVKFGDSCEKLIQCFIELNKESSIAFPTYFYYRSLAAVVSLVRLSILVKSDLSAKYFPQVHLVKFNLSMLHQKMVMIVESNKENFDSAVCERFLPILKRIDRWVDVVESDKWKSGNYIDFMKFTAMSKGQEIEKLVPPKTQGKPSETSEAASNHNKSDYLEAPQVAQELTNTTVDPPLSPGFFSSSSVQEIFREIDEDVFRFLNPFDAYETGTHSSSFPNDFISRF